MISDITTGNTKEDGRDFRFWFVGPLEKWSKENNVPFDPDRSGLRNTEDIEVKWGTYKKGEKRSAWAERSDKTAMSILVSGDLVFKFCDPKDRGRAKEVRLSKQGDYVIWKEDVEHTWRMEQDSEILTLRWLSG